MHALRLEGKTRRGRRWDERSSNQSRVTGSFFTVEAPRAYTETSLPPGQEGV